MLSDPVTTPKRIFLRSFYGFSPEDDGYIGWSNADHRDRMMGRLAAGDLFMIYGAKGAPTAPAQRGRILGFLQVEARAIHDREKASAASLASKRKAGAENK